WLERYDRTENNKTALAGRTRTSWHAPTPAGQKNTFASGSAWEPPATGRPGPNNKNVGAAGKCDNDLSGEPRLPFLLSGEKVPPVLGQDPDGYSRPSAANAACTAGRAAMRCWNACSTG